MMMYPGPMQSAYTPTGNEMNFLGGGLNLSGDSFLRPATEMPFAKSPLTTMRPFNFYEATGGGGFMSNPAEREAARQRQMAAQAVPSVQTQPETNIGMAQPVMARPTAENPVSTAVTAQQPSTRYQSTPTMRQFGNLFSMIGGYGSPFGGFGSPYGYPFGGFASPFSSFGGGYNSPFNYSLPFGNFGGGNPFLMGGYGSPYGGFGSYSPSSQGMMY